MVKMVSLGGFIESDGDYSGDITFPQEELIPHGHEYLLDFVSIDFSKADALAQDYLSCIDWENFDNSTKGDARKYRELLKVLLDAHPYFRKNPSNGTAELNQMFADFIKSKRSDIAEADFIALLKLVCVGFAGESFGDERALYFIEESKANNDDLPVFGRMALHQRVLNTMLFTIFDRTNQRLSEISIEKRAALYCTLFYHDEFYPLVTCTFEKNFIPNRELSRLGAALDFAPRGEGDRIQLIDEIEDAQKDPAAPIPEMLAPYLDALGNENYDGYVVTAKPDGFEAFLEYEISEMIEARVSIKKCKNCGRYFVTEKGNVEYCPRVAAGETKPCSEIGKMRTYQAKVVDNDITAAYTRAYKTHFARIRAGKLSKDQFNEWTKAAKGKLEAVKNGEISQKEYEMWLKDN